VKFSHEVIIAELSGKGVMGSVINISDLRRLRALTTALDSGVRQMMAAHAADRMIEVTALDGRLWEIVRLIRDIPGI